MSMDRIQKRSSKRSIAQVSHSINSPSHPVARRKTSPAAHAPSLPSETSSASETEVSSMATYPSTMDTEYSSSEDDSSDLSESSDDPSSDSDGSDEEESEHHVQSDHNDVEEEEIATITPLDKRRTKPNMRLHGDERQSSTSLRHRLKEFIPQMAAANEVLEKEREEGLLEQRNIEIMDENDGEAYIELDLGLGVLEEKQEGSQDTLSESKGSDDDEDVLGKLLGRERPEEVGIEVVEDA